MAAKPLHIEHASREDLLQVPGIGVERVKVILARRKALGGTMTELEFLELGFPSSCTQKILDENYIQFSEQVVGLDKSSLLSVQSSADFGYQTDTANTVSHGKTEFDICDAKSTLLQSDDGTDTKPTAFHDEKPVGAPNELVTVSTLLVFESRIIKEFRLVSSSLSDKIDGMKSSLDEVKSTVTTLEDAQKTTQSDLEQLRKHVTDEIPKQQEKYEQNVDRVESSMNVLKRDVCDLRSEVSQAKDSADTAHENCKSEFNAKIEGVNHTISDIKSSVAENRAELEDHKNKVENDMVTVKTMVREQTSKVNQSIDKVRSDTYQHSTESLINFSNCQQQVSACGEEIALIRENFESSQRSIRGDVTKVSDSAAQLRVRVPRELTVVHKRIDETCQPMQGDIVQLKQQVGTMTCSVGSLQSEGHSHQEQLETLASDVRQLKTAMTQSAQSAQTEEKEQVCQVLDASVHEISELKSEKESFLVRYLREDEEQNRRIRDMQEEGDHLLVKAQAMKEQNLSFMNDYFKSRSGILKRRIEDSINSMKCNFDEDYIMPSGWEKDLEWTGLDLLEPHSLKVPNTETYCKEPAVMAVGSNCRDSVSNKSEPKVLQFAFQKDCRSSTPVQSNQYKALDNITHTINSKTLDGRYVGRKGVNQQTPTQYKSRPKQYQVKYHSPRIPNRNVESDDCRSDQSSDQEQVYISQGPSESDEPVSSGRRPVHRSRNLRLPKMSFDGTYWRGFVSQFEAYARRMQWTELDKVDAFAMCLRKEAAEYFSVLPETVKDTFDGIKLKFEQFFERNDSPSTIRWEILSTEQREDETLEKYLARLQKLILSAYPDSKQMELHSSLFIEAFLKGCRDKAAAVAAGVKRPSTLEEAYSCVKTEQQVKKAILGKKGSVRKVKPWQPMVYSDSDVSETSSVDEPSVRTFTAKRKVNEKPRVSTTTASETEIKDLTKSITQLIEVMSKQQTPQRSGPYSPSRNPGCYECGDPGHFVRDCPRRKRFSSPGSPRSNYTPRWQTSQKQDYERSYNMDWRYREDQRDKDSPNSRSRQPRGMGRQEHTSDESPRRSPGSNYKNARSPPPPKNVAGGKQQVHFTPLNY